MAKENEKNSQKCAIYAAPKDPLELKLGQI